MEFLTRVRLQKPHRRNPNTSEMEIRDSVGINNAETVESVTVGKRETDEEEETGEGTSNVQQDLSHSALEMKAAIDTPPTDDCCPICFGSFAVACRASCGHWYCGGCILQYWNYGSALQPCKCPMCFRQITRLKPEASLYNQQEVEVIDVLKKVHKYNRLFVGGTYGLFLKVLELPFFLKRIFQGLMDPDRVFGHHNKLRFIALFLGLLYTASPFDFLPTGRTMSAVEIFDYSATALSFILYFVGLYLRRRRLQNARQLVVIEP